MNTLLSPEDLQDILRQVAQLSGVEVTVPFPHLAPHLVHLAGAISIHGDVMYWETDIDLRGIECRADIAALIGALLDSFDAAASL